MGEVWGTAIRKWGWRGGGGGIRTHGALSGTRDFQSRPLGRYGTPPLGWQNANAAEAMMASRRAAHSPCKSTEQLVLPGGRGGIRTRGALFRHAAFRERYHKPLGHPSTAEYNICAEGSQDTTARSLGGLGQRYQRHITGDDWVVAASSGGLRSQHSRAHRVEIGALSGR